MSFKFLIESLLLGSISGQIRCGRSSVIPRGDVSYGGDDTDELNMDIMLFAFGTLIVVYIVICIVYFFTKQIATRLITAYYNEHGPGQRISLFSDYDENNAHVHSRRLMENMSLRWPNNLDDADEVRDKLAQLSPEEQFYYKQGEEYIKQNPPFLLNQGLLQQSEDSNPDTTREDPIMNEQTRQYIQEEGAYAWEFSPNPDMPNHTVIVENKTEVSFLNYNYDASISTNLPIPCINKVYYCEFKIFETDGPLNSDENVSKGVISFGLSTQPYPYFRLPGRHHHSIAYDSNGARRFNDSFKLNEQLRTLFPQCEKGDIVGIGYRSRSGTVFFTRNGKKLNEKSVGGHIRGWKFQYLYPIIGSNVPCQIHVNFGTYGFVYIEANVKKWGYAKSNGIKLPPPSYEDYGKDTLLESGGEDNDFDEDFSDGDSDNIAAGSTTNLNDDIIIRNGEILPPPPGFEFTMSPPTGKKIINEEINLDSLPMLPPSYSDDEHHSKNGKSAISGRIIGTSRNLITDEASFDSVDNDNEDENDHERDPEQFSEFDDYESRMHGI
ncbi:Protein EAR1 [Saccharomyces cerevisiae]|nr:Protein EAR1 [Saccharomyces cerevisiae]CAI4642830.1 CEQ_1a_G0041470.mRNA.1.CDS.1 [Saccharomyces cerevisiae]CAI4908457.1 BEM_HP_G0115870.mRNA.1.CDS.1 [Saccharomyces cerevisiae]CAI4991156.1 BEM_HP_G0173860.mRNA.1.CDS.1 [Saccharomyces cerevisiae]CAI4994405.1 BEM_HP_G0176550.mRNA.1.CDS.1 [Saccharomyces cerevisiae]